MTVTVTVTVPFGLTFMWCGTNPNAANQYFVPPPPQPNSSDCASAQHGPNGCKNCIQEWTHLGTEEDEDGIQRRFLLTKGKDRRIHIDVFHPALMMITAQTLRPNKGPRG